MVAGPSAGALADPEPVQPARGADELRELALQRLAERGEYVYTGRFEDYDPLPLEVRPARHWSWRTIDAADVLRRWSVGLPPERVHVVTVPPAGSPRDLLWTRFAQACDFDPSVASLALPPILAEMDTTISGVAGTLAVPTIVSGNARRSQGSLEAARVAETPYG